jgi:hypothetical protein
MKTKLDKILDQVLISLGIKRGIINPHVVKRQDEFVQKMNEFDPSILKDDGIIDVMYLSTKARKKSDLAKEQTKS